MFFSFLLFILFILFLVWLYKKSLNKNNEHTEVIYPIKENFSKSEEIKFPNKTDKSIGNESLENIYSYNQTFKEPVKRVHIIKKDYNLDFSKNKLGVIVNEFKNETFRTVKSNNKFLYSYDIKKNIYLIDKENFSILKKIKVDFPITQFYLIKDLLFIETYENKDKKRKYFFKIFDGNNLNFIKDYFDLGEFNYYIHNEKIYFPLENIFNEDTYEYKKTNEVKFRTLEINNTEFKINNNQNFDEELEFVNYKNLKSFKSSFPKELENKFNQLVRKENEISNIRIFVNDEILYKLNIGKNTYSLRDIKSANIFKNFIYLYSSQDKIIFKLDFNFNIIEKFNLSIISDRVKEERILEYHERIKNYLQFFTMKSLEEKEGDVMFLLDENYNLKFYIEYENDKIRDFVIDENKLFISVANRIEIYKIEK